MKSKNVISLVILFLVLISCKEKLSLLKEKDVIFQVEIEIKIKNDDDLILYYKDGTNEWFMDEKAIWSSVKGSNNFQKVVFRIPQDVLPNDFRLDIGRNEFKGQAPIEINKFIMLYDDNSFEITKENFSKFFRGNQFISYDEELKKYILKKDEQGNYDPFFETKSDFYPELINLIKQ